MQEQQKKLIASELRMLAQKESQRRIAKKAEVSAATISQMVNGNWKLIKSELWKKVQLNLRIDWGWQTAETENLKLLNKLLWSAQQRGMSICISHNAGAGKSHTYKLYERAHAGVVYLESKNYWTKKSYVRHLLLASGLDDSGTVEELVGRFTDYIKSAHHPLVIIDQFDKLKDGSMDLFMDFYNELDGSCGFVLSGVPALKKRIERGCQFDKIGFRELKSRIGSRYIHLDEVSEADVTAICNANGVDDEAFINEAYNTCEGDLRRVRRDIEKYFLMSQSA